MINVEVVKLDNGMYSEAYYYDKDGNPCKKEDYVTGMVCVYDSNGKLINEMFIQNKKYIDKENNNISNKM